MAKTLKNRFIAALAVLAIGLTAFYIAPAHAGGNDLVIVKRKPGDDGEDPVIVSKPAGGADGLVTYDGAGLTWKYLTIGSGLSVSGGALQASTPAAPSQSAASRSLNTGFQPNTTRPVLGIYSVQCTITASIAGGQNCDVVLEIASDSGFTANVQTLSICGDGQTYTLAVALQGVQPTTKVCMGWVPASFFVRLRTVQNTGTPTFAYRAGQEIAF